MRQRGQDISSERTEFKGTGFFHLGCISHYFCMQNDIHFGLIFFAFTLILSWLKDLNHMVKSVNKFF